MYCLLYKCFLSVWLNLRNNFLIECLTISAKFMYQLKIWQLEECMYMIWIGYFSCLTLILPFATIVALGGVCQLKSLSYLQYTTCNHSEQVFSYRSEPTFIQTRHFSLDSQVLDFTHTKRDREYQISSCH